MQTLILTGVSPHNKEWAEQVKQGLESHGIPSTVIYWPHWESGVQEPGWIEAEAQKIVDQGEVINILAKSAGTAVAMVVLKLKPEIVNKLILCGIPFHDLEEEEDNYYQPLKDFPAERVLCIQNEKDNHGSYKEAKAFLDSRNPAIKVISKPRNDHEYPYPEEFIRFLTK